MELLQLRYFCHAAETESFTVTAKHFCVPPSDISQSIKRLEKELGVSLFDRSANRIRLNSQGRLFQKDASTALAALEHGVQALQEQGKKLRIKVQVSRRLVMKAAEQFQAEHPGIDILLTHREQEDFDLCITAEPAKKHTVTLLTEPLLLAVADTSPLSGKEQITAEDLANVPFITMAKGNNLYDLTCQVCSSMGFMPHIAIQGDDPMYIRQCVELGLGVAIVPAVSWKGQFSCNVKLKNLSVPPRTIYLQCRPDPSEAAKDFAALLIRLCDAETSVKKDL